MAAQTSRDHHTVPKLYLRGFCHTKGPDKNQLLGRDRRSCDQRLTIKQATVVTDFYGLEGKSTDRLEKLIGSGVENPVGPIMAALRRGALPAPGAAREPLEIFIALQMVRTVAFRKSMIELTAHLAPTLFASDVIQEAVRSDPSLKDRSTDLTELSARLSAATPAAYREPPTDASVLRNMVREAERLTSLLKKMDWYLSYSAEPQLLTGDAPAVVTDCSGRAATTPQTLPTLHEVHLPITPHRLLTISPIPRLGQSSDLTTDLAQLVNQAIARNCTDYVFRRPDMAWPINVTLTGRRSHLPSPAVSVRSSDGPATQMTWPAVENPTLAEAMKLLGGDPEL